MELFSLLSSLPYIKLYETPVISFEKFLEQCATRITGAQMTLLEQLSILPGRGAKRTFLSGNDYDALYTEFEANVRKILPERSLIRQYAKWEMALRNSLARIRSAKWNNGEAESGIRPDAPYDTETERIAQEAYGAANPLERERILDEARWNKLDDLVRINNRHNFSFDAVCAYGLKLHIVEKWEKRTSEAALANLNKAAEIVQK